MSNRDGLYEVFVASYPFDGVQHKISEGGGVGPLWSSTGREIYYRGGGNALVVPLEFEPAFAVGAARVLFEDNFGNPYSWDIFPDDQHFVMHRQQEGPPLRFNVVFNWFEELQRRVVPTER